LTLWRGRAAASAAEQVEAYIEKIAALYQ